MVMSSLRGVIFMLGNKVKHTQRYQEVLNVFLKNGFSHILFRIGLTDRLSKEQPETKGNINLQNIGIKLRESLQELGPTFIKLGQIASSRRDLVPEEIAVELEKLQDDVLSFPFETVREIVETELGEKLENVYENFEAEPLATASIGQVHIARLFSGEEVAVKIQRPDIVPSIESDLNILHMITRLLERKFAWARRYNLLDIIDEFSSSLRNELDYRLEGRNGERIAKQFIDTPDIHIPRIYWTHTSKKVLTMEMIRGIKANRSEKLKAEGYDLKIIASRIAESLLHQVLEEGFFHGDPHAGNIYILPGNRVAYLDFGMVGRLNDDLKYHFASLIIGLQQGDTNGMIKTFTEWGILDDNTNMNALKRDIESLITAYYDVPLEEISLGKVMVDIFSIAYKHQIEIPNDIAILGKVILTTESIIEQLDPSFSIMQAVEPYGKKLILERYHPQHIAEHTWNLLRENVEHLSKLPKDLKDIASVIKKGKLGLDVNVTDVQAFMKRLDRISNRLSFSIILLSFSILMVGLIIGASISEQTTLLFSLPVIEIGAVVATLMFLFMIYTIIRSGRM